MWKKRNAKRVCGGSIYNVAHGPGAFVGAIYYVVGQFIHNIAGQFINNIAAIGG